MVVVICFFVLFSFVVQKKKKKSGSWYKNNNMSGWRLMIEKIRTVHKEGLIVMGILVVEWRFFWFAVFAVASIRRNPSAVWQEFQSAFSQYLCGDSPSYGLQYNRPPHTPHTPNKKFKRCEEASLPSVSGSCVQKTSWKLLLQKNTLFSRRPSRVTAP